MAREQGSVSQAVQETLLSMPLVLAALGMGIVNYSALSRLIKREVERKVGREVSETSVKMAVIRFQERSSASIKSGGVLNVVARSSASLIDDVGLATLRGTDPVAILPKVQRLATGARIFQLTQGIRSFTIVTDEDVLEKLLQILDRQLIDAVYRDQAAVILVSPREIITTPGVIAYLTTLLAFHGVNLTQLISTHTDTLFIVERRDAVRAYTLLRDAIDAARGEAGGKV